jgi:hypothetical protein
MTTLDPALCARLVSKAREDAATIARIEAHFAGPHDVCLADDKQSRRDIALATIRCRKNNLDLADQLEAALAENERLPSGLTKWRGELDDRLNEDWNHLAHIDRIDMILEPKP